RLVRGEPDAVPGTVDKLRPEARLGDHLPRRRVYRLAADAGARGLSCGPVRLADDLIDTRRLRIGRLSERDGASDVGGVALPLAADVYDDYIAALEPGVAGMVMGQRAVRAEADQRGERGSRPL